jgi:hypothetical protein
VKQALIVVAALLLCQQGFADPIELKVPGETWSLRFRGPVMQEIKTATDTQGHVYTGNAGRFNLSLHVYLPDCQGGDSPDNLFKCFGQKLQQNPYIVPGTMKKREEADGVSISYLMEVPRGGQKIQAFNANFVFAHGGKWGDLHVSVVNFTKADLDTVTTLLNTVELVDPAKPASH